jgi:N-acetylmuramoyl-L-alanine amidase
MKWALPAVLTLVLFAGCGGEAPTEAPQHTRHSRELRHRLRQVEHQLRLARRAHRRTIRADASTKRRERDAASSTTGGSVANAAVAIDPGHNGANGSHPDEINKPVTAYADGGTKACDTTGTETNDGSLTESALNFDVASTLADDLRSAGVSVVMTRTSDDGVGPCINERAEIGNRAGAAAAISIHADGAGEGEEGFHVIYPLSDQLMYPAIAAPSNRLAIDLRDALVDAGINPSNYVGANGLDGRSDLGGLNMSSVPKVFVELGNMRSAADASRLESSSYRGRLASALQAGLQRFLAE